MQNHRIIPIRAALVALALCASIAAAADAGAANPQQGALKAGAAQLAVVPGANPSPAEKRVTELLAERIKDRAGIELAGPDAQAKFHLVIGTTASNEKIKALAATRKEVGALGADGYVIAVEPGKPELYVADISMWGNHPGMLVNKEYWKSLQAEMNDYTPGLMKGGWPYSERWNTDIASVMMLSWFWNPKKTVVTVLDEYTTCYFGPAAAAARELLDLLDDSNKDPQRREKIRATQAKLENSLPEWVKRDWRWAEIATACQVRSR